MRRRGPRSPSGLSGGTPTTAGGFVSSSKCSVTSVGSSPTALAVARMSRTKIPPRQGPVFFGLERRELPQRNLRPRGDLRHREPSFFFACVPQPSIPPPCSSPPRIMCASVKRFKLESIWRWVSRLSTGFSLRPALLVVHVRRDRRRADHSLFSRSAERPPFSAGRSRLMALRRERTAVALLLIWADSHTKAT